MKKTFKTKWLAMFLSLLMVTSLVPMSVYAEDNDDYSVDALAEELEGQVAVYNVDVDANSDLAMQYRVMSVPSLLLFKDGQVAGQTVGYQSADEIKAFIANN